MKRTEGRVGSDLGGRTSGHAPTHDRGDIPTSGRARSSAQARSSGHASSSGYASTRRRFLAAAGGIAGVALAGCSRLPGLDGDGNSTGETLGLDSFRGSGALVESRPEPGGTPIADLPDLEGELTLYLGGGEGGLYTDIIDRFERIYPDFKVLTKPGRSSSLANLILTEMEGGGTSPADVFLSIDAGSLGVVADAGATTALPDDSLDLVPEAFRGPDGQWVGLEGRARTIPYNTNALSGSDVPDDVMAIPESEFAGEMGWAPAYGAFQSFVTAMRLTAGEDATRNWLTGMLDAGVESYQNEFLISNTVADGGLAAGFANHYYVLRVRNGRPDAPLELGFTSGDAGALVNVSGASVIEGSEQEELATDFVRHFLSSEVQEFFATVTFGYPMIPEVAPAGGLPTIEELDPPDLDLTELSNLQPTLDLLREVGAL